MLYDIMSWFEQFLNSISNGAIDFSGESYELLMELSFSSLFQFDRGIGYFLFNWFSVFVLLFLIIGLIALFVWAFKFVFKLVRLD